MQRCRHQRRRCFCKVTNLHLKVEMSLRYLVDQSMRAAQLCVGWQQGTVLLRGKQLSKRGKGLYHWIYNSGSKHKWLKLDSLCYWGVLIWLSFMGNFMGGHHRCMRCRMRVLCLEGVRNWCCKSKRAGMPKMTKDFFKQTTPIWGVKDPL